MSIYEAMGEERARQGPMIGVAIAIVTNNQDPDGLGRVKVKFPWRGAADESYWARIATLMAGDQRGTYFLPEVGDELLVAFEAGDVGHPYVLGALWNGQEKPPESNTNGNNDVRKIKSRSGHEIVFNDEQAKESVLIKTKAGHTITLDDSSGAEKIEIKDKTGSNSISIDSAQNAISVQCSMQLSIKANVIQIEADSTMTLKAGATLTLQGGMIQIN
jgi:uncharacterized protein involved in type VI secretion and phage assembly